jgi:hypothetical protein
MGIEDSTGRLTSKELKTFYMARVDCHLIHGCEVSPDSEDVHVKELCAIQVDFLRQILNVHCQSLLTPLFTETRIMLLRTRRFIREFAAATGSHPVADQACGSQWLWLSGGCYVVVACTFLQSFTMERVILESRTRFIALLKPLRRNGLAQQEQHRLVSPFSRALNRA